MQLSDLQPNTPVTLEIEVGNKIYPMETSIAKNDYEGLLLLPIYSKNQLLDFSKGIFGEAVMSLFVSADNGNSRMQWKNVSVEMFRKKTAVFYRVSVRAFNSMGMNVNRRGNNRFNVIGSCTCVINDTGATFRATMSDISVSGIAFTLPAELPLVRVNMEIAFDDVAGGTPFHIQVKVTCIRTMNKNGVILYGCTINSTDKELLIYLSNKQEDLSKHIDLSEENHEQLSDAEALRRASAQNNF